MEVLRDKKYKNYSYISRYASFPIYYHSIDEKYLHGTQSNLSKDCQYTLYKVTPHDTPDSIALEFYNNPTYYWIILDFNDIKDPFEDLPVGLYLKIPTITGLKFN